MPHIEIMKFCPNHWSLLHMVVNIENLLTVNMAGWQGLQHHPQHHVVRVCDVTRRGAHQEQEGPQEEPVGGPVVCTSL
jgi:hypothetical protein